MHLRQIISIQHLGLALGMLLVSCSTEKQDSPRDPASLAPKLSLASSSLQSKQLDATATSFFVHLESPSAWQLRVQPEEASSWISLQHQQGQATAQLAITVSVSANTASRRNALLIVQAGGRADTLELTQRGGQEATQTTGAHILGDTELLELPALSSGAQNYFVTHYADGRVNYSLEYDTQQRHSRWVAFSFDDYTSRDAKTGRTEAWAWDPSIPKEYSTEYLFRGSGYDRGHLVASADRRFSLEANKQTYYYSNMSPQISKLFNQSYWAALETKVRTWGTNSRLRDVLYVAKGGTIRPDQVESYKANNVLIIPKYYWMALLLKKGSNYHALGFWVEHRNYSSSERPGRAIALSIDELEQRTGLDFFHNLPDDIEQRVEAEQPTSPAILSLWPGL